MYVIQVIFSMLLLHKGSILFIQSSATRLEGTRPRPTVSADLRSLVDTPFALLEAQLRNTDPQVDEEEEVADSDLEKEIKLFMEMKITEADVKFYATKPLEYWKRESTRFPTLAKLTTSLLIIPASSGSSERMFSKAGWMCALRLNRVEKHFLKPKHSFLQQRTHAPQKFSKNIFLNGIYMDKMSCQ